MLVPILYIDVSREGEKHILEMDEESWREGDGEIKGKKERR